MKYIPLNFGLMSVWQNWFIVVALVWLGGLALYLVAHPANVSVTEGN
jgi:hypothetical protein